VRRTTSALLGLLTTGVLLAPALPAAAAAPQPVPAPAVALPPDIEELAPYAPQVACDPVDKPGTAALARLLTATYPGSTVASLSRPCAAEGGTSEHYDGRAVDWGVAAAVPAQAAQAQAFLDWLLAPDAAGRPAANARRLGIMYVIWDARILGTWDLTWKPYTCSGVTACHRDHVHVSLSWAGARGATSWWTGMVAPTDWGPCRVDGLPVAPTPPTAAPNPTRCPAVAAPAFPPLGADATPAARTLRAWAGATLAEGANGPVVAAVQGVLGVPVDGGFGPATGAALRSLQAANGLPATGVTDPGSWRVLLGLPPAPPTAATASPGTGPAPAAAATGRPASHVATAPPHGRPVLRLGSRGAWVRRLQGALHLTATGIFGPSTRVAVQRFQRAHHLAPDGVVGARTWAAWAR